jgi:hypothetical protein
MDSMEKLAQYYDNLGRAFYKTAQADMVNASTEYGTGSKVKSGFLGLVKRISGRLKSKNGKIRPGYAKRRRK